MNSLAHCGLRCARIGWVDSCAHTTQIESGYVVLGAGRLDGNRTTNLADSIETHDSGELSEAFTTALTDKFPRLILHTSFRWDRIPKVKVAARDGGLFDEPVAESVEQRRGSAQIAIDVSPSFDKLLFIEQNRRNARRFAVWPLQIPTVISPL